MGFVQRQLGLALRARVAGEGAVGRSAEIWGTPGPRRFSSADPIWRVHDNASMYAGGIAALLLQSLHPQAMAGVAGHSGYKSDPWGRLQRTADYIAATTFGTDEIAEASFAKVRSIHSRVRGKDYFGRPYRADDPDLLRWVGTAEAYAFLTAFQRFARAPLSRADADTYVAQAGVLAAELGATDMPTTVAQLDAALTAYRPHLVATPAAREAADFLLKEPPLPLAARGGYALLAAGAVALLPDWAREALDLPLSPMAMRLGEGAGKSATAMVAWGLAGLSDESARADHRGRSQR
ncbi:oxygenase MpaB family protein [Ammonicoccus fulvus]|uniref:Oxygenase MpaB family protein n=1 Tax=Ammonicoccus fulvus TaxID=3138240 RepID=A0ABZ3FQ71_9ACTN